ncbi:MAG: hypothetical protein IKP32_08195 [Clostridia bacterium]|nr:hypothetical protein [Clostridia bacterium]
MKKAISLVLMLLLLLSLSAALADEDLMLVRTGGSFTYARMADGTVWAWGDGGRGQLGSEKMAYVFINVPGAVGLDGKHIADIQCANASAYFLMDDGTVYATGFNDYGQLGVPGLGDMSGKPVKIPNLKNITRVACGFGQCLALDQDGHVWVWGRNGNGQLGNGATLNKTVPFMLDLEDIVDVQCGGAFSMALAANGDIWGWGDNEFYQLGAVSRGVDVFTPTKLPMSGQFVKIGCGGDVSFGIDADGTLWAWGRNDYYQMGTDACGSVSKVPMRVALPEGTKVEKIIAYNSHAACITTEGEYWLWGSSSYCQLGRNVSGGKDLPKRMFADHKVLDGGVGSLHTAVLLDDGTIWSCGSNYYGQLGFFYVQDSHIAEWKQAKVNLLTCVREK